MSHFPPSQSADIFIFERLSHRLNKAASQFVAIYISAHLKSPVLVVKDTSSTAQSLIQSIQSPRAWGVSFLSKNLTQLQHSNPKIRELYTRLQKICVRYCNMYIYRRDRKIKKPRAIGFSYVFHYKIGVLFIH